MGGRPRGSWRAAGTFSILKGGPVFPAGFMPSLLGKPVQYFQTGSGEPYCRQTVSMKLNCKNAVAMRQLQVDVSVVVIDEMVGVIDGRK